MKHNKHLTPKDFDQIKKLLELGLSVRQIADIIKRSASTVNEIRKQDSYESYRNHVTERNKLAKQRVVRELSQEAKNLVLVDDVELQAPSEIESLTIAIIELTELLRTKTSKKWW